jgi:hypothetical protein
MLHLYFFVSSCEKDGLGTITVISKSVKKAFALAYNQFAKHNYQGKPLLLAI